MHNPLSSRAQGRATVARDAARPRAGAPRRDRDRKRAAEELRTHHLEGRLDDDERRRLRPAGVLQAHDLPVPAAEAYEEALDSIVEAMVVFGYDLVERHDGQALVFEQRERPAWVYLACVAAFPVGLLALSVKRTTRVRIDVLPRPGDRCRLRIVGQARRPVRKASARLSD